VEQPQAIEGMNRRSAAVDRLLEDWTPSQQVVVDVLRGIILDATPAIQESVKFSIPFYVMNGFLFYISPQKNGALYLAFCLGRHMGDHHGIFIGHDRKEVRHIVLESLDEHRLEIVRQYVLEAVELNRTKRSFTKNAKR
jgi:hypothetical protein